MKPAKLCSDLLNRGTFDSLGVSAERCIISASVAPCHRPENGKKKCPERYFRKTFILLSLNKNLNTIFEREREKKWIYVNIHRWVLVDKSNYAKGLTVSRN